MSDPSCTARVHHLCTRSPRDKLVALERHKGSQRGWKWLSVCKLLQGCSSRCATAARLRAVWRLEVGERLCVYKKKKEEERISAIRPQTTHESVAQCPALHYTASLTLLCCRLFPLLHSRVEKFTGSMSWTSQSLQHFILSLWNICLCSHPNTGCLSVRVCVARVCVWAWKNKFGKLGWIYSFFPFMLAPMTAVAFPKQWNGDYKFLTGCRQGQNNRESIDQQIATWKSVGAHPSLRLARSVWEQTWVLWPLCFAGIFNKGNFMLLDEEKMPFITWAEAERLSCCGLIAFIRPW